MIEQLWRDVTMLVPRGRESRNEVAEIKAGSPEHEAIIHLV